MDQGWKGLLLLVNFLLLGNAYGFRDGAYSNAHHHWGQPSDNMFSPRAVQSSVSEVPVIGNLPEVGSSLFANRPLKRLNLLQFVKGRVSSGPESMSHAQTAPSTSVLASLPLPLNEQHAGSLTSLQGSSGSTITVLESTGFPAVLGTSGLSTSNQSPPSLYMSSSQETKSAQATLPVFSQESISNSSSSAPGTNYTSQGSPVPLSEGSDQSMSPQGQSSYSSLSQSQGALSPYTPDSYNKLSYSVSSQSTSDQSTPSLYGSSFQSSSGSLLGASGSSLQVDLSPQSQISNQLLLSPLVVSSQSTSQSSPSLFMVGSMSSSDSQSTGPASPLDTQVSLSHSLLATQTPGSASSSQGSSGPELSGSSYSQSTSSSGSRFGASTGFASQEMSSGSVQPQGTTSQFAPGSPSSYPSVSLSSPQGAASQSATVQSSRKQFSSSYGTMSGSSTPFSHGGSLQPQATTSQFAPGSPSSYPSVSLSSPQGAASQSATVQSSRKQFSSSYGTQSGLSTPLTLQGSTTYGGSLQLQGTTSQFAPGSPSSYPSVSLSSPQGAGSQSSRKQFSSSYGTMSGSSTPFSHGGSLQPQATTSQFAPGSPSSYPSVSLSSPQGAGSQSSRKQFSSSYGTMSGSSTPFSHGGSLQPQATTSQFAPGSPSSYPSVSLSSPQGAASQSATVQSSRKQFSSSYGTQSGLSTPLTLQGSTTYGGSLQLQGTTSQFAPGSPSSYPSVSLSSPQGAASQSATVQSSRKQFSSSYGTQSGLSTPLTLQGSTTYGGSLQLQGTSQFAPGSPSSYPSVSLSSPQGASSQSSRKQFSSSYGTMSGSSTPFSHGGSLQPQATTSQFAPGSPSSYPSVSLSSPQGAGSQSATVQSSRKQFSSSYGTQSGLSTPLTLQGSTTYGGSLQLQGTTSQFAPGSPSSYPSVSLSSPQGAGSQSSRKQFSSSYGTMSGSSTPFSHGGSLQPQATTSQFAPGSPSSYPSVSLSSPQGAGSQSSRKQFSSSYGTMSGSSTPFSHGGSLQPQATTSQFAPGSPSSYPSVSLSSPQGAASQSATVQSSRKQFSSSYGTQSGLSTPLTLQGSTTYGGSLQLQGTSQFAPGSPSSYSSVSLSSPQGAGSQSSRKQFSSSYGTMSGSSTPFSHGGSLQPQATTSQFAPGSPSSYPSVSLSSPQGAGSQSSRKQFSSSYGTMSGSSTPFSHGGSLQPQATTSQFAPGSPSSYPSVSLSSPQGAGSQSSRKQFSSSYGTMSGSSTPFSHGGSLQPQATTSQFAPGSPSSYPSVSLSSPQGAGSQSSRKQFSSSYGTMSGSSTPFSHGGSLQPQATTSQFAPGSPSSYPSVSLSSPQGAGSQSSRKQFSSSYGTMSGSSTPFSHGGSLQPQATTSQFAPGSPSSYPSVSLSSPQGAGSQSSRKQFSSSYGTMSGSSTPFSHGGSLQPQATTSQFAPGSPSSYPSVSLSSPQGAASQSATVQSSRKQFSSSYGTQSGLSTPLTLQGSTTYGGSLQLQGTSQFAPGSPSSYSSVSLSSPQGASSQSSRKQFSSSYGTMSGSSTPFSHGGSLQPQATTSQFAPGSPSSYPSVSLSSPQGAASQSATVQSSRKQFSSRYGTQSGLSTPLTLQGSTTYGGSLQLQGTTSQFAPGSPSSYPSVSLSSPQGAGSQSSRKQFSSSYGTMSGSSTPFSHGGSLQPQATTSQFAPGFPSSYPSVSLSSPQGAGSQSSRKQFSSSYGTESGLSTPLTLQGSTTYGGSLQLQGTSQFAPGSPSSYSSVSLSLPQGIASQSSQAYQSYSVAQNQKSQRWPLSEGIQISGAAVSQGSSVSQSSPMQSRFSSLSLGGSSSGDPRQFASAQGGSTSYSGFSLHSQSPSSKYTPGSHAYAKLGSSPLAVSSSDRSSNGLYSSESRRTQSLLGVVERPSRLSFLAPFDSPSSNQISEHLVTLRRPMGSNLAQSLGLSAQASSVGMFSGIPQTSQALRESGSDVQLYNKVGSNSRANAYTSHQKFSSYGAQSFLKPSELLSYEPSINRQAASSASELLNGYGLTYNQIAPASKPSHSSSSSRYSIKG